MQPSNVDANKVIAKLNEKLAAVQLQLSITEVALEDAQEQYAVLLAQQAAQPPDPPAGPLSEAVRRGKEGAQ